MWLWCYQHRQSIGGASNLGGKNLGGSHPDQRTVTNVEHENVHLVTQYDHGDDDDDEDDDYYDGDGDVDDDGEYVGDGDDDGDVDDDEDYDDDDGIINADDNQPQMTKWRG